MGSICRRLIMMKKIIRIAVCYQARSQVEAGKSGSQLYGFHVPWIDYSTDFHHLYNHSIHHSLTTHLHSGTVVVPVRSLSGSIIGIIGMISVIPFHSMRAIAELQKKV